MSSNIFNGNRFLMLWRQHFIHNTQLLVLSTVAYIGVMFIVLSFAQLENQLKPHDLENFHGFLIGFVAVFGVLYVGHSFPAFRSKESTMNYLMVPASVLEKFFFELISRIGIMLLALPLLYWMTFHVQGYFFTIFTGYAFEPIGLKDVLNVDLTGFNNVFWLFTMISTAVLLGFVLAFTGSAMFTKQPLVKSLFSVAIIIAFFAFYSYIVIEHLGVGQYNPPDSMWLVPTNDSQAFRFFTMALSLSTIVMLFVAYRKLKEREV